MYLIARKKIRVKQQGRLIVNGTMARQCYKR